MRRVPTIRFKDFTDPWEERKFSDVFDFMRNNTLSRAELSDFEGSVLNVHYGDVLIKFGEVLDVEIESLPHIADDSLSARLSCPHLADGDVIIADTAEDEAVGKCSELRGCRDKEIVSGLHTMACRPLLEFASGYLGYYLNSPAFHEQLLPLMQGIKVISVSKTAISDTDIRFPSLPEQKAIGASLSSLDRLITLHQRKYNQLIVLKKALLNKMFPRDGKNKPEIRFAGFTDPWEQRKLGELTSILSAARVHKDEWRTEGVPFYRSSDVMAAFNGTDNERVYISQDLFEELSARSGVPEQGDVMVTGGGSVGTPYIVPDNRPLYTKDADLIWIKHCAEIDPSYLFYFFVSPVFRAYIESISHVGTIAHYTIEQVRETGTVFPPTVEEQTRIGSLFVFLDNLITLHQRKLEVLRHLKSALLEKMFV